MAGDEWRQRLEAEGAYRVTEIPRPDQGIMPEEGSRSGADQGMSQRVAALAAAYHAGGLVAFGWVRTTAGGPVHVVAAGDALAGSAACGAGGVHAADADVLLALPGGARGTVLHPGELAGLLDRIASWRDIAGISDGLLAPDAVAAHGADLLGIGRASVAYLSLRLANGGIAHAHVNWLSPTKIRTVIVGGAKRTAVWNDLNPQERLAIFDRGVDVQDAQKLQTMYRTGDVTYPALEEKEALRSVMEEFARAIRAGDRPLTDGYSGLRVLATLEAAQRSMAAGGAFVPLDLDNLSSDDTKAEMR